MSTRNQAEVFDRGGPWCALGDDYAIIIANNHFLFFLYLHCFIPSSYFALMAGTKVAPGPGLDVVEDPRATRCRVPAVGPSCLAPYRRTRSNHVQWAGKIPHDGVCGVDSVFHP